LKPLLLKRSDIIREYGVSDRLMRAIEKSKTLVAVKVRGYKRRLYRRTEVEKIILGDSKCLN
jgi:hypothetical protein